jgi:large subunit ribosomal protein L10
MNKEEKALIVADIVEKVGKSTSMVLTDFAGLTVEQSNLLRKEFRASNIEYKVAKNTFFKRAIGELENSDKLAEYLKGQTGIAFGYDDPVESVRILKKFVDKNNKPAVKAIYFEKGVYPGSKLDELSKLPSKKDLYGSIVGCIQAPIAGVPSVVNSLIGGLISVIEEVAKKNEKD